MSTAPAHRGDAVDLLDADHIAVKKLFGQYKQLAESDAPGPERQALADRICLELSVHMQLEEEAFYPPVRQAVGDEDIMDEADVEHEGARKLIAEISSMKPDQSHFDAKVKMLGEMIDHHVGEERGKVFPKARQSDLDLVAMAAQLKDRKRQIVHEFSQALS
ncbi:MAG: hemerythrin domain-containing protein [Ramlibacter sp.]|nr:hemerythrin domain-containing protein [Ramlibacter sp.]